MKENINAKDVACVLISLNEVFAKLFNSILKIKNYYRIENKKLWQILYDVQSP